MKIFGTVCFLACLAGVGIYYGGYVDGEVEVRPTTKAKTTFNQGIDAAVKGIQDLKVDESAKEE